MPAGFPLLGIVPGGLVIVVGLVALVYFWRGD